MTSRPMLSRHGRDIIFGEQPAVLDLIGLQNHRQGGAERRDILRPDHEADAVSATHAAAGVGLSNEVLVDPDAERVEQHTLDLGQL